MLHTVLVTPADRFRLRLAALSGVLAVGSVPLWIPRPVPEAVAALASDKVLHAIAALGLGLGCGFVWKLLGGRTRWLVPGVAAVLALCEGVQLWMPHRSYETLELLINALGGALGTSVGGLTVAGLACLIRRQLERDAQRLRLETPRATVPGA